MFRATSAMAARFNRETLQVKFKGASLSRMCSISRLRAGWSFSPASRIVNKLKTLEEVGLGYIRIGQPSTDAFRRRGSARKTLARSSPAGRRVRPCMYWMSLRLDCMQRMSLLGRGLQRLVDGGNTVLIIEHNLDIIKVADYIIDLGPEGGDMGGELIGCGTPREICESPRSLHRAIPQRLPGRLHKQSCQ